MKQLMDKNVEPMILKSVVWEAREMDEEHSSEFGDASERGD